LGDRGTPIRPDCLRKIESPCIYRHVRAVALREIGVHLPLSCRRHHRWRRCGRIIDSLQVLGSSDKTRMHGVYAMMQGGRN
jgi:hypothetical protein